MYNLCKDLNAMTTTLTPTKKLIDLRERIAIKNRRRFTYSCAIKQGLQIKQVEDERERQYRWGE